MGRPPPRWGAGCILRLLALSFLCCCIIPVIIALLTTPAFVLRHALLFALLLAPALAPIVACRVLLVRRVPEKRLGILGDQRGAFKGLLPPGSYVIIPGRARIKELLSLEPASVQMPLLGLHSGESDLDPLVMIFAWRVHPAITAALQGTFQQQVRDMLSEGGSRQMEAEARSHLEAALRRRVSATSVNDLRAALADTINHPFEEAVKTDANALLEPLGLEIERIRLLGAIKAHAGAPAGGKTSAAAREAQKLLAEVYKKLEAFSRSQAFDTPARRVAENAWHAYELLTALRMTVHRLSLALQTTSALLLDTLDAADHQPQRSPDQQAIFHARQRTSEEINHLQDTLGELGKLLIALDVQAKQITAAPFALTPAEIERLLDVLRAIEQQRLTLENVYP